MMPYVHARVIYSFDVFTLVEQRLYAFAMTDKPKSENPKPEAPAPAKAPPTKPKEIGGPKGPEPTRFGDWEQKGRVSDF
jgi:hypothetical protein